MYGKYLAHGRSSKGNCYHDSFHPVHGQHQPGLIFVAVLLEESRVGRDRRNANSQSVTLPTSQSDFY